MLTCTGCKQTKLDTGFTPDPRSSTGYNRRCKECVSAYHHSRYERIGKGQWDTGELTLDCKHCGQEFTYTKTTGPRRQFCSQQCKANAGEAQRANRAEHATRRCACGSAKVARVGTPVCLDCRKEKNRGDRSGYNRMRRLALYGLTQNEFDELLTMQRGKCAICATDEPGPKGWHVDHDHACCPGIGSCGACVRGLLCHCCNLLLGNAKDSIELLERAQKYLTSNSQFKLKLQVVRPDA